MFARNAVALGLAGVVGTGLGGCEARRAVARDCPPTSPPSGNLEMPINQTGKMSGTAADAWAIGHRRDANGNYAREALMHWDGCDWQEAASPFDDKPNARRNAVWTNGRGEVWLSGMEPVQNSRGACPEQGGRLFRQRAGQWEEINRASTGGRTVWEIAGNGGDDVWMLEGRCSDGLYRGVVVRHWDGKAIVDVVEPNGIRPQFLWAAGPRDVWVAGDGGAARWDGTAWRSFPIAKYVRAISGTGPSDVWVSAFNGHGVVHRWNGRAWTDVPGTRLPMKPRQWGIVWLSAVPGGRMFATDAEGTIYRSDRAGLAAIGRTRGWMSGLPVSTEAGNIFVGGRDDFMMFLGARRPTLRWSNGTWTVSPPSELAGAEGEDVVALWADGAANLWAAVSFALAPSDRSGGIRAGEIRRWNGKAWERAATLEQFPKRFWGIAPDDVWLVGLGGASWHWDGKRWTSVPTGTTEHLFAVWGGNGKDVWAAGEGGATIRWDGAAWRPWATLDPYPAHVLALGGSGADNVIAAGWSRVKRWDGRGWAGAEEGDGSIGYSASGDLRGIWGSGPHDFWLVGTGGDTDSSQTNGYRPLPTPFILHGDGKVWKRMKTAGGAPLNAITGTAANDVWTVGEKGTVFHWNGARWSLVPSGTEETLLAVAKTPDGIVWVGGVHGTLKRIGLGPSP